MCASSCAFATLLYSASTPRALWRQYCEPLWPLLFPLSAPSRLLQVLWFRLTSWAPTIMAALRRIARLSATIGGDARCAALARSRGARPSAPAFGEPGARFVRDRREIGRSLCSAASGVPEARPSATMILAAPTEVARARASGHTVVGDGEVAGGHEADYRILFVRRSLTASFMPGAYVFPGGMMDPADEHAALCGSHTEALQLCAVRELFEETGLLCLAGAGGELTPSLLKLRADVIERPSAFPAMVEAALLAAGDSRTAKSVWSRVHAWARFVTPDFERKRFDAHFFLHCARDGADIVTSPDSAGGSKQEGETIALAWFSPREALELASTGDLFLPPPQWYLLNELSEYTRLAELEAAAATKVVVPYKPHLVPPVEDDDSAGDARDAAAAIGQAGKDGAAKRTTMTLALPGDAEHPTYDGGDARARHRILMTVTGKSSQYELQSTLDRSQEEAEDLLRQVGSTAV